MPLCLTAGALAATLAVESFTLAWNHSIEKIRWEEDWRIEGNTLMLDEARIRGTGAGMEPPAGAVLKDGVWHYRPEVPPQRSVLLAHSPYTAPYQFCVRGNCRTAAELMPGLPETVVMTIAPCSSSSR